MNRERYDDGERPRVDDERDAVNEALASEPELAPALEAMVAALAEDELTAGSWEALRAKLRDAGPRGDERAAKTADDAAFHAPTLPPGGAKGGAKGGGNGRPRGGRGGSVTTRWAVGLALVAAVVLAGSWASLKAAEAASLRDDQRILAYWMANPEMRLVALSAPAGAPGSGPARLGVVCVLPDGRALLLQPSSAPRGASYIVTGSGPAGTRELARGRGNMLQFDASGVGSVEVVLAEGRDAREVIARAELD